ncbi:MAG: NAD(P)H-dependent oxidoreductase subunit E [Spirochaetes bacterium]|nr:NAD(P)H-dependent oxidoreductase subunit E [Spirochaetota bacterium]MBU1079985.1 NAD(P)H-dependent oxidoreductase subunit E [Spirochaetota bacterium]
MLRETLLRTLDDLVGRYGKARENLLPVLQDLQAEFGFLGEETINEVARAFGLSQTEVFSVASFYHFLNTQEKGKYVIRICRTISCDLRDKANVLRALESELGIKMGETTRDKKYSLDYANCMGTCDRGPSMMVNDRLYADLSPSKAVDIIRSYR